jgi:hypothetical protein
MRETARDGGATHDSTESLREHVATTAMHGRIAEKVPIQADWMLQDAYLPENVQAMAQESVARSRELYRQSAAAAQGHQVSLLTG